MTTAYKVNFEIGRIPRGRGKPDRGKDEQEGGYAVRWGGRPQADEGRGNVRASPARSENLALAPRAMAVPQQSRHIACEAGGCQERATCAPTRSLTGARGRGLP